MNALLNKLKKFARKEYRDGYMQTQVRAGIVFQIQALRDKFGYSQTRFAEVTGKKQSVISRLENTGYGRVTVQTLLDIASSLNVALLVKFVSYPEFISRNQDMSVAGLQVETIDESLNSFAGRTANLANPERVSQGYDRPAVDPSLYNLEGFRTAAPPSIKSLDSPPPGQKSENKFLMAVHH